MRGTIMSLGLTLVVLLVVLAGTAGLIAVWIPPPPRVYGFINCPAQGLADVEHDYAMFVPLDYDYGGTKTYPLILLLHARANGKLLVPTSDGLGKAIRDRQREFPFFALFPRIKGEWWDDSAEARAPLAILEHVEREYRIDKRRVYLTGFSTGGTGVWHFASKYPDRWAAIVPVSGAPMVRTAPRVAHIPCWMFTGERDPFFPPETCRRATEALRAAGGEPRFTELKGQDHHAWNAAYGMPELYTWLLEQRRPE